MNLLIHQYHRIDILEVECSMLQNLTLNIHKVSLSFASNNKDPTNSAQAELKEE
jgi:hypothetical protein